MRVLLIIVTLSHLTQQGADGFVAEGRHFRCFAGKAQGAAPSCHHDVRQRSSRHATLLDETDKLLFERMDSDQVVDSGTDEDWSLIQIMFCINILLAWVLFSHGSPPINETTAAVQNENGVAIERIQQPPTYNQEEDVTMWMDSSAGFFFY